MMYGLACLAFEMTSRQTSRLALEYEEVKHNHRKVTFQCKSGLGGQPTGKLLFALDDRVQY